MLTTLESIGIQFGPIAAWLAASLMIFMRYFLPASIVFFWVYHRKRTDWFFWKIQQKFPKQAQINAEIKNAVYTALVFGGMAIGVFILRKFGYGALYYTISEHGWGYYFFSIIFMIVAHDTYFYWTHRLLHHPTLFKRVHLVHHKSINTTPYTSFSFHPLESIVEFGIVPLIALVLPIHASALFLFTIWSIAFNVMGHTGYEFNPSGATQHWLLKWLNTPTHHNMHHEKSKYNYGLYFNFWDRMMGTNHPDYESTFEGIKTRTKAQLESAQNIRTTGITGVLLLLGVMCFGQININEIKNGQYGTPESRAIQADEMMQKGLGLTEAQIPKVKAINLKYSYRIENEVVKADLSNWSKYQKIMAIQEDKDKELEKILDKTQFERYETKRDELLWQAVKAFFF